VVCVLLQLDLQLVHALVQVTALRVIIVQTTATAIVETVIKMFVQAMIKVMVVQVMQPVIVETVIKIFVQAMIMALLAQLLKIVLADTVLVVFVLKIRVNMI